MTSKEYLIACFKHLCETQGVEKVAEKTRANVEGMRQILRGVKLPSGEPRGVGHDLQKRLDRDYPGWARLNPDGSIPANPPIWGPSSQTRGGVAHPPILSTATVTPVHKWGDIVPNALPEKFSVALPDDAMAPGAPAGSLITFVKASAAQSGQCVLLTDRDEALYFREYRARTASTWQAVARNPSYLALDSASDGLTVIAVMTHISKASDTV